LCQVYGLERTRPAVQSVGQLGRSSRPDIAGQILWDTGPRSTVDETIRLLRNRFGNVNQAERFRAELRARRIKPGESLQQLYQDVCQLMSIAYLGPTSEFSNIVARDAFLKTLGDSWL